MLLLMAEACFGQPRHPPPRGGRMGPPPPNGMMERLSSMTPSSVSRLSTGCLPIVVKTSSVGWKTSRLCRQKKRNGCESSIRNFKSFRQSGRMRSAVRSGSSASFLKIAGVLFVAN